MKLYFANLQKYNEGFLDGQWFDLEDYTSVDDLMTDVQRQVLHQRDNSEGEPEFEYGISQEEWAIHDYDAPFTVSEYTSIQDIDTMISFSNLDEDDQLKAAYLHSMGYCKDLADCIDSVDRVTIHKNMSMLDLAYQRIDDEGYLGEIPKALTYYIDYKAYARDIKINESIGEEEGNLYEVYF